MNRNVTATILVVLAIGIYFTVTEAVLADAGKVQAVNLQYLSAIDNANKLIAVRDQVTAAYNNISQSDRDRLAKMIPNSVDNIRLVIDLNSVALNHGFSLQGITAEASSNSGPNGQSQSGATNSSAGSAHSINGASPSGGLPVSIDVPTLDTVDVSFSVTAPYLQFISFMQDLEANLRIMDITHLTMTSSDTGVYTFQVGLKTYWLRQQ